MFTLNPINRQRLQRFKRLKRAYVSFWLLLALYVLGLLAELLCNGNPYYVHYQGQSYFPFLAAYSFPLLRLHAGVYPEDTFLHNGVLTPPNYKKLSQHPVFTENPDNFMIFPPFPFGPNEIIPVETIAVPREVTVTFLPHARVGSIDVLPDLSIHSATNFTAFIAAESDQALRGASLATNWPVSAELQDAVSRRFANQSAAAFTSQVRSHTGEAAIVSLHAYTPRQRAPSKIRLRFEELPPAEKAVATMVFTEDLSLRRHTFHLWPQLSEAERTTVLGLVKERLQRVIDDRTLTLANRTYRLRFSMVDVRYPFRPVPGHIMGIDNAGRDVFARILYALRISLNFGLILVAVTFCLGILLGAIQGYFGGFLDITGQRLIEIWSALPFLYVIILLGSVFGRSFTLLLCIYAMFNWIGISYYMRAEFLKLRQTAFVEAAKCLGIATRKIIFRHILPNSMVPIITFFPFSLVGAIGALSALDYLGFGLPPPTPSWGELLSQAQVHTESWFLIVYPFLALFSVIILGVFIGEGLRSAFDPRSTTRLE
jgi:microcin C transport system permease protein